MRSSRSCWKIRTATKRPGLGEVGSRLVSLYPDFDVRSYGYNMLSKFLEQFSRIQLVKHGHIINVALRENAGQKDVESMPMC